MIRQALHRCCLVMLAAILAGCAAAPRIQMSPTDIHQAMVGTWRDGFKKGRLESTMVKTYFADGTAKGWIQEQVSFHNTTFHPSRINFTSRWRIEGDVVVSYDVRSHKEGMFKPSDVLHDRLLSINAERAEFIDLDHGGQGYTMVRVKGL